MCLALFVASGSFFLGQADEIPEPLRIYPLLAIPAFLPLVALLYWLWRVCIRRRRRTVWPTAAKGARMSTMGARMKAVVQVRYGSADGLELREVERPEAGDDRVLVRVRAAAVNASDWHLLRRLPHLIAALLRMPRSRVRGTDLTRGIGIGQQGRRGRRVEGHGGLL